MGDTSKPNKPRKSSRDGAELRVVRIRSKPTPDAQDRLRRLFTLLVRYATAEGTTTPDMHSPKNDEVEVEER